MPGAVPALLGVSACQIRDRRVPLDAFWGGEAVRWLSELAATPRRARVERAAELLVARLARTDAVADDEPALDVSERARLREAERQLREVKMENEFLKKAAAYFAQNRLGYRTPQEVYDEYLNRQHTA